MSNDPYQTPVYSQPATPVAGSSPYGPIRSLGALAAFSSVMLIINIVLNIAKQVYSMSSYYLKATTIGLDTHAEVNQFNETRVLIIAGGFIVLIITAIAICMWTSKAMANAWARHKVRPTIAPGWASGWYFIPFANLWKPYEAAAEIWRAVYGHSRSTAMLLTWWLCWIISGILNRISSKVKMEDTTAIDLVSTVLSTIAAVLLIIIIRRITQYYSEKISNPY